MRTNVKELEPGVRAIQNDIRYRLSEWTLISIDSETYELALPALITVKRLEVDNYVASFYEAGIFASGETKEEAIIMLADVIAHRLDAFKGHELGSKMEEQRKILEIYLRVK